MKKFLILFSAMFSVLAFADVPKFPNWSETDLSKLDASIKEYSDYGKGDYKGVIVTITILKDLNTGKLTNFSQFLTKVDEVGKELPSHRILLAKKQIPLCTRKFIAEAYQFCKNNPSFYDINYLLYFSQDELMISVDEYVDSCSRVIFTNKVLDIPLNAKNYGDIIGKLLSVLPDYDAVKSKELLQKLNRKFSPFLVNNKEIYEPIVAKIRTALEVY